ncbi:MAG: M20 family metallopeptidase [Dehalococcoidia bacterium]
MDPKTAAQDRVDELRDQLIDLSHRIHANPELGFHEEKASAWLADALADAGFAVERGACDLPTAFVARAGIGPLHVAICAEYDCLPGIGHACGHNIIATAGIGAGIAAARVADEVGLTVSVIGTPAEEGGGGKIMLLDRGAFSGVHAAMMVHPAPADVVEPPIIAVSHFDVHYTGKEAHASSYPEQGINAADAITVAQVGIGLLRQHMRSTDRIHGIVTKGGEAPNIVPAHTSAKYYVRARTLGELDDIRAKVNRCLEAGALATGATMRMVEVEKPYAQMEHDAEIAGVYKRNAEALGRKFPNLGTRGERFAGSTDMGNISLVIPSIHPMIGINSWPAANHQPEFTEHCATASADKAVIDGALAMAWTAIDLAMDDQLRDRLLSGASVNERQATA